MIRRAAFALLLCLAGAAGARAGDDPPKPAEPKSEAAADAPVGHQASVKLKNGRTMSGVLRVAGSWEHRDEKTGWTECGKDDAGACLRLWYVSGGDGYLVVRAKDAASVEIGDALDDAAMKKLAGEFAAAEKRADEERERLRKERAAKRAAEEKAAAEAPKPKTPEQLAKEAEEAAAEKHAADLLAKFPPPDWGPERRDEINRRALIMKLMPTTDERQFLDEYATWARAAAAAAAKATADKKDAEKRAAEKKEAERKEAEKKNAGKKDAEKKDAAQPDAPK